MIVINRIFRVILVFLIFTDGVIIMICVLLAALGNWGMQILVFATQAAYFLGVTLASAYAASQVRDYIVACFLALKNLYQALYKMF